MGTAVKWHSTSFRGVRYREHPTKKHGVGKDRYFAIRYQKDGKREEEGLGWASDGWTTEKAAIELSKLKQAATLGEGPVTLKEKRALAREKQEAQQRDSILVKDFYKKTYTPYAKREKKESTWEREDDLYRRVIEPAIGNLPMRQVSPIHLEKIKKGMADAGKAPRTIQYALAVIRMIFNVARKKGAFVGENPISRINMPKVDNGRLRYLTPEEARKLLDCLQKRDANTYEMALVSLLAGLRLGEIASLCWQDIDARNRIITVRDPKNKSTRVVYMCDELREMFQHKAKRHRGEPGDLVFLDSKGKKYLKQTWHFRQAVKDAKLNNGITDKRLKFTFHGLRHTHGSWAAQQGVDILTIKEMLGHRTLVMAMRYSHLSAQAVKAGVNKVAENLQARDESQKSRGESA